MKVVVTMMLMEQDDGDGDNDNGEVLTVAIMAAMIMKRKLD